MKLTITKNNILLIRCIIKTKKSKYIYALFEIISPSDEQLNEKILDFVMAAYLNIVKEIPNNLRGYFVNLLPIILS